ncbi:TonB-dependent receptor plug domain-containing protein [Gloeobacter violaceus]|uniref:Glr3352 protein n=1 Tax=Gloeobacter violaceus (strain ATCC 29082 / PCC 7421) TaxID=251221 RepID=Q7NG22_GLOVI|nr:TonB-dependent receptor [Gloeobacter violaceus]BAC91293.1 glr3352 [Gloeobacter violaceus PCC 7421]
MITNQRRWSAQFFAAALIPALAGASLLGNVAQAKPVETSSEYSKDIFARALPTAGSVGIEAAKKLLEKTSNAAADLQYRPPLWDWTAPATVPSVTAQATPPAPPAAPPEPAADTPDQDDDAAAGDILDEVSVTATRRLTRARDTTATTYTINREDFQKQGATTVTDALLLVPGFVGQPSLGGIRNSGANFLRGFDDQRFQVLKDGLPLQRSSNNRTDVSRFQVADLERIEVVTGGATLRYGSGAVGGVINLITETPKGPPKLTLSYEAGSYGFSRYLAKYGGGDDTFSYNLVFTSTVAFNNYPFSYTLPNSAQFYPQGTIVPNPNFASDPENQPETVDLFGYLQPEVGPPIKVQGVADVAFNASDTYSGKLTFKPDPSNRLTFRVSQQNSRNAQNGPGTYSFSSCFGGPSTLPNGTLNLDRFLPLDANGNEVACSPQRFLVNTRSNLLILGGSPFTYTRSLSGVPLAPGQAYPTAEGAIGTIDFFAVTSQSQTEVALQWDYDITPTTSLNSYIYYFKFSGNGSVPPQFGVNTDILGGAPSLSIPPLSQPFFEGQLFAIESVLNHRFSPGGNIQFGVNVREDRSYQQKAGGSTFFDRAFTRSSVFAIADISFSDQFKANLGARFTYSNQYGTVGTPAVGLRYTPANFISFRTNYSYVFNSPSLSDLFVGSPQGPFFQNPNLRPEAGVTWDAGIDLTPAPNVGIRATYFNTYLDGVISTVVFPNPDFISFIATPGFNPLLQQQRNLASRYASGLEVDARWQVNPEVSLRAVWTNQDARPYGLSDDPTQSTFPFFYGFQDPFIPFNNVVVSATYANKGLTATLLGRYDGGKRRFASTEFVANWFTLDLNVEVPISSFFILTGSVFNITDSQYESIDGIPAPGTTFRVGGRFEIGG